MIKRIMALILSVNVGMGNNCSAMEDTTNTESADNNTMTFILGSNKNYITQTLVTIYSLLKNGIPSRRIQILILIKDLTYIEATDIASAIELINQTIN